jgi:hypothetical protein
MLLGIGYYSLALNTNLSLTEMLRSYEPVDLMVYSIKQCISSSLDEFQLEHLLVQIQGKPVTTDFDLYCPETCEQDYKEDKNLHQRLIC